MRSLLLISTMLWCLVLQAATSSLSVYSTAGDREYMQQPPSCMVRVPMRQSAYNSTARKALQSWDSDKTMPNTEYKSRTLFSVGQSAVPVSAGTSVFDSPLLSERGFSSTSIFRDGEQVSDIVPCFNAAIVRKGPPGGGSSTGEWLPLLDAWWFLMTLAAVYCLFKKRKREIS